MLLIIFVSAGYILTLPPAASGDSAAGANDPQLAEIRDQRRVWRQRQPEAFEYVIDRDCACEQDYAAPYRVTVNAAGTAYRYDADYSDFANADRPPEPADIDLLFDLIEAALVSGQTVQAFYDTQYGYPAIVRISQAGQRPDEEFRFDVRDFRVRR